MYSVRVMYGLIIKYRNMQEYRKHVLDNNTSDEKGNKVSFCGESGLEMMFHFTDVEHVVRHRQQKGRMLPCIQCKNAIIKELSNKD